MKQRLRIAVFVFVLAALLLGAIPASAKNKTYVTGLAYWGEAQPAEREWITGQYVSHVRNQVIPFEWVTSDPRLNGYVYHVNNADWHFTADWEFLFSYNYGHSIIYAEPEYITPLWDCTVQGILSSDWSYSAEGVCNGLGVNRGTHVDIVSTTPDLSLPTMDLQAWIVE